MNDNNNKNTEVSEVKDFVSLMNYKISGIIIKYLANNSPVVTHQFVNSWNFEDKNEVLDWIVENPKTDKATALMLYWLMTPSTAKAYANRDEVIDTNDWFLESFDTIEKLEAHYLAGFYTDQNFAFDPKCDARDIDHVTRCNEDVVRKIPHFMMKALEGKEIVVSEDWDDGLPSDLLEEYDRLIKDDEAFS